jgi:hypothetical protein
VGTTKCSEQNHNPKEKGFKLKEYSRLKNHPPSSLRFFLCPGVLVSARHDRAYQAASTHATKAATVGPIPLHAASPCVSGVGLIFKRWLAAACGRSLSCSRCAPQRPTQTQTHPAHRPTQLRHRNALTPRVAGSAGFRAACLVPSFELLCSLKPSNPVFRPARCVPCTRREAPLRSVTLWQCA